MPVCLSGFEQPQIQLGCYPKRPYVDHS